MDKDELNIIALIAERKIAEAQEEGAFDNLEGMGRPLPEDDLAALPDEVRLTARILRQAGYLDAPLKDNKSFKDTLGQAHPEEASALRKIEKLRLALEPPIRNPLRNTSFSSLSQVDKDKALEDTLNGDQAMNNKKEGRADRLLDSPYIYRILSRLF
ncbi:MAG: DUF1992 domain-containing protein [Deltaproteobacteria bacterium]|nr:DUF1992 domain-containing protein [Deltaproteobacteria bacterium]